MINIERVYKSWESSECELQLIFTIPNIRITKILSKGKKNKKIPTEIISEFEDAVEIMKKWNNGLK